MQKNGFSMAVLLGLVMLIFGVKSLVAAEVKVTELKDSEGMTCWVYAPEKIDPAKRYWLVVGVHGYRGIGKGAAGMKRLAAEKDSDFIVIGPSFENGYQGAPEKDNKKLLELVAEMKKNYKLHDRFLLYGFSGGSQFAHRYLFKHPETLAACSAHSGGTWELKVPKSIGGVPCAFSCGTEDKGKAYKGSPYARIDFFKEFSKRVQARGFEDVEMKPIEGVGHKVTPEVQAMTMRCFELGMKKFANK